MKKDEVSQWVKKKPYMLFTEPRKYEAVKKDEMMEKDELCKPLTSRNLV